MAILPALTSLLAFVFALMLVDQWRERRHGFQAVWAFGMLCYAVGAGAEAIAEVNGWNEGLYRVWYLTGAVWTAAGWASGPRSCSAGRASATRTRSCCCCPGWLR
jgi:hypothetical protein